MKFSQELSDQIQKAINEFASDPNPFLVLTDESDKKLDLRRIASEIRYLPVAFDLGRSWGIKPNGETVAVIYSIPYEVKPETNQKIINMVLFRTARNFPNLKELTPVRNPESIICPGCDGTGIPKEFAQHELLAKAVSCNCGGVGWLPSADKKYLYFSFPV